VFEGVEHRGPSYEGRVFLNNSSATAATPRTVHEGFAGSFHVFGHGECFGSPGHCEVTNRGAASTDLRDPHPLRPMTKTVVATDAVRTILVRDGAIRLVLVVPIVTTLSKVDAEQDVVRFEKVSIRLYAWTLPSQRSPRFQ
jgi:tyrosinase